MKLAVFLVASALGLAGCGKISTGGPVRLILDTDMESDVNDVGAVAVLHALADNGEAEILATMICSNNPNSPACLAALNTYYGRPDIPIGVARARAVGRPSRYAQRIAKEFPQDLGSSDNAPGAVPLYRKILAEQPDESVVICTIGYLTNLRNLIESRPDEISDLSGADLVARKVKLWVCMGGEFPRGRESNFKMDADSAHVSVRNWPAPIAFCGWEIGVKVDTGSWLVNVDDTNPVRRAYELFNGVQDRHSWDQTAVLYAVRGLGKMWLDQTRGYNHVAPDGYNDWRRSPEKDHSYLIEKMPPTDVAATISQLMIQTPRSLQGD